MYNISYREIKQKIQHCSNELNNALKLVNEVTSITDEYSIGKYSKTIYSIIHSCTFL